QLRVGHEAVAVEALDVVALVGGAVAPDVDAVLLHSAHEQRPGDRTAQGSGVEVGLAAGADVERAALQGDEALLDEQALGVDEAGDLCAVLLRAGCDAVEVGLVVLADIGRVGAGDGSLVAHPRDCAGGVKAAGEGDSNVLTDWERRQYFRHGTSLTARWPPCRIVMHGYVCLCDQRRWSVVASTANSTAASPRRPRTLLS